MQIQPRERVLLVDDDPQVLIALEGLLRDRFSVLKTTSPDHALHMLESEHDIAVLVTDQRMPKMDGDELLARIGHKCKASRIMVTGFADLSTVIRAVNEGNLFAFVSKPWDDDDLRNKVDRAAERFRALKELVSEHQLLNDLMVHSPDGIYIKDRELRFVQANRAFAQQSGRPLDTLLGRRLPDLMHDWAIAEQTEAEERALLDSGAPGLDVLRADTQGATTRWFSETKAPIHARSGEIVGLLGIAREVTERITNQQSLARSEARLRAQSRLLHAILDSLAEGVIVADQDGKFLLINRPAKRLLGVLSDELAAQTWAAACGVHLLDRKTLLPAQDDPLLRAMRGEVWSEIEVYVRNATAQGAQVVITGTPLADTDGNLRGGIAVLRDVTAHKALDQRLAQAHRLEAVGRLAGGVAHDFNNLLSVIQSCSELMLRRSNDERLRDDLNQILTASERAALLTRQLMLFSRQQSPQVEVLRINEIVLQLKAMLGRILGEDIVFTTHLDEHAGAIKADRSQIEQIIVNLTVNARDAMPDGGELTINTRTVRLNEQQLTESSDVIPGEFVVLSVSDSGVGMDAQTQEHMFEPFYTTKAIGKGTGLGLATVYGIVRQNRGFLRCESSLKQGTRFEVYLPSVREPASQRARAASVPAPALSIGTILLVEDEDPVRSVAARLLRMQGYQVHEARVPSEARQVFDANRGHIDVLVTDVVMPETNGAQLAKEFRQHEPGLRVVFMSGYAGGAVPVRDVPSANSWYLDKPFTATSLLAKVAQALTRNN